MKEMEEKEKARLAKEVMEEGGDGSILEVEEILRVRVWLIPIEKS